MNKSNSFKLVVGMLLFVVTALRGAEIPIKTGDTIAFLGDSITQLGNTHKPNGYIHLVIEGLKEAGIQATPIPAGIGGNTTRDMLTRLEKDIISKKPTWMTINSGINDCGRKITTEEFGRNLKEIVERSMQAGIKVILMTTTIGSGENLNSESTLQGLQYCQEFKKLAKEKGLILVDLNTMMAQALVAIKEKDPTPGLKLTFDGTHLNGYGNQLIATEILKTLNVPEQTLAKLTTQWHTYPSAEGMAPVSINTYLKLKAAADKKGVTVDEFAAEKLTESER